jgi:alpha-galactosidase
VLPDDHGRPQPALNTFPSATGARGFAPLGAQAHRLGLRFGAQLMRGLSRQAVGCKCRSLAARAAEVMSPTPTH